MWIKRIWNPFYEQHSTIAAWAEEAKAMAKLHARLATADAKDHFHKWISKSISEGGADIHKFVKTKVRSATTLSTRMAAESQVLATS